MTTDTISIPVNPELLHGIFVTALEGGIGYWSTCHSYRWSKPDTDGEEDLEHFRAVIREHEDDTKHVIDRAVVLKGLRLAVQPGHVSSEICEDALADIGAGDAGGQLDAFGADAIVQLGLFGEIVYG